MQYKITITLQDKDLYDDLMGELESVLKFKSNGRHYLLEGDHEFPNDARISVNPPKKPERPKDEKIIGPSPVDINRKNIDKLQGPGSEFLPKMKRPYD